MKPEDALELLDRTVAQMNGPRQVHVQLQQAIECLRTSIKGVIPEAKNEKPVDAKAPSK